MNNHLLPPRIGMGLSLLLLFGLLLACDSTDNNDNNDDPVDADGVSDFSITGGFTGQFKGNSFFATSADAGDSEPGIGLVLYRVAAQDTTVVFFIAEGSNAIPSPDSYTIALDTSDSVTLAPDEFVVLFFRTTANSFYSAIAESGTLTIESNANDQLKGRFTLEGEGFELSSSQPSVSPIEMSGTFTSTHAKGNTLTQLLERIGFDSLETETAMAKRTR